VEAAQFYASLADRTDRPHMKRLFEQFVHEEEGHKAKLEKVKKGKVQLGTSRKILDLKIAESLADIDLNAGLSYQEALIVAMKAEKAAFKLYTDLATLTNDATYRQVFLDLAQEEAKHKLRFEIEYDDYILTEG
jgi:rubrerythrin